MHVRARIAAVFSDIWLDRQVAKTHVVEWRNLHGDTRSWVYTDCRFSHMDLPFASLACEPDFRIRVVGNDASLE